MGRHAAQAINAMDFRFDNICYGVLHNRSISSLIGCRYRNRWRHNGRIFGNGQLKSRYQTK